MNHTVCFQPCSCKSKALSVVQTNSVTLSHQAGVWKTSAIIFLHLTETSINKIITRPLLHRVVACILVIQYLRFTINSTTDSTQAKSMGAITHTGLWVIEVPQFTVGSAFKFPSSLGKRKTQTEATSAPECHRVLHSYVSYAESRVLTRQTPASAQSRDGPAYCTEHTLAATALRGWNVPPY